jgi:O-antigen ligase
MTQLCELGIIGTILFLLFYGWIGKSLLRCRKEIVEDRKITEAYFSGFIIILFMGLSIFQYYNPAFFLLSGAMIAHVIYAKGKNKSKNL